MADTSAALQEIVEQPAGELNGSNVTFSISHTPVPPTFRLYLNGIKQSRFTPDYTLSGTTITMRVAPKATDQMLAEYFIALPATTKT